MTMDTGVLDPESNSVSWEQLTYQANPNAYAPEPEPQQQYVEPAAEPMYAPTPELSYQQPYEAPAEFVPVGEDVELLPEIQSPTFTPQLAPYNASPDLLPMDQGPPFDWTPETFYEPQQYTPPPAPFFQNPQFAERDAQFDASTDPNNYSRENAVGAWQGLQNLFASDPRDVARAQAAGDWVSDQIGGVADGYNGPGAGGARRVANVAGDIAGFGTEMMIPTSMAEMMMTVLPGGLPIGPGMADDALRMGTRGYGGALLGSNLDTLPDIGAGLSQGARAVNDLLPSTPHGYYSGVGGADDAARQTMRDLEAVTKAEAGERIPFGADAIVKQDDGTWVVRGFRGATPDEAAAKLTTAAEAFHAENGPYFGRSYDEWMSNAAKEPANVAKAVGEGDASRGLLTNSPAAPDPILDTVRAKFLTAAQQEMNMRRTGAVDREIRQGRSAQAAGIREAINGGGTLDDVSAAARQGAYQGGTLRKTTLLQPIVLDSAEQVSIVDELSRLARENEISDFDFLRFVMPAESDSPGIIARLQSETPRLQPNEIKLIRKAFGDEFADAVAARSASSLEPKMTRAQERAEMARIDKQEQTILERAQRDAVQAEQRYNREVVRGQERVDSADFRAAEAAAKREQRRISDLIERGQRAEAMGLRDAARQGRVSPEATNRLIARFDEAQQRIFKQLQDAKEAAERARLKADELEIAQTRRYNEQSLAKQERSAARDALKADRDETTAIREGLDKEAKSPEMIMQSARAMLGDILAGGNFATTDGKNALELLDGHITRNRAVLDGLHDAEGWRSVYEAVRATVTGDLADSYLTSLIRRDHALGGALVANGMDPKVARKVATMMREYELARRFPQGVPERITKELAKTKGAPYNQSWGGLKTFNQRMKNTMFGLTDAGVFGTHMLAAINRGGLQGAAGLVNRTLGALNLPNIETHMLSEEANLSKRVRNTLDGVHYGTQSSGVDTEVGTVFSMFGRPGKAIDSKILPLINWASERQFNDVMGFVGDNVYEGQLVMLHMLGRDISNPVVRATAADFTNSIKSFADTALHSGRNTAESIVFTSQAMTRAGISNILQMSKFLNPTATAEERILAAGLIASQGVFMLTVGKFLNDELGITDFQMDPSKTGFGQITLPWKDPNGRNRVIDLFPQTSVQRAIARSFRAIAEGDSDAAEDAWLRYFSGRASVVGSGVLGVAGVGYTAGAGGRFTRDLSARDRVLNLLPIPPLAESVLQQATTDTKFDPAGNFLTGIGQSNFPESRTSSSGRSASDRYAQQLFQADFYDIPPKEQVQVLKAMEADGQAVDDRTKAGPWAYASNGALHYVQQKTADDWELNGRELKYLAELPGDMSGYDVRDYETMSKARDAFEKMAQDKGATRSQSGKAWDEYTSKILGIDKLTRRMREEVIDEDPSVIDAAIREFEAGNSDYDVPEWARDRAKKVSSGAKP